MIHLVLNRRGVILVAEGDRQRLRPHAGQEKRRLAKVIGSAPLYDFILGHDEGEVPLRKLRMELMRLPEDPVRPGRQRAGPPTEGAGHQASDAARARSPGTCCPATSGHPRA